MEQIKSFAQQGLYTGTAGLSRRSRSGGRVGSAHRAG